MKQAADCRGLSVDLHFLDDYTDGGHTHNDDVYNYSTFQHNHTSTTITHFPDHKTKDAAVTAICNSLLVSISFSLHRIRMPNARHRRRDTTWGTTTLDKVRSG